MHWFPFRDFTLFRLVFRVLHRQVFAHLEAIWHCVRFTGTMKWNRTASWNILESAEFGKGAIIRFSRSGCKKFPDEITNRRDRTWGVK